MTRTAHLFALTLGLLAAVLAPAATAKDTADTDGWVVAAKARSPSDISLWTRTVPGAQLKSFRGATHLETGMESMVAFLYDTSLMQDWLFRCKEARILEDRPDATYVYLRIKGIWPLEDRDAVVKVVPEFVAATGEIRLRGTAAPDFLPKQEGHIRIPAIESTWLMRPAGQGQVYVEWWGHVDPAGNVPRWLSNSIATLIPRYTIKQVREQITADRWKSAASLEAGSKLLERIRQTPR